MHTKNVQHAIQALRLLASLFLLACMAFSNLGFIPAAFAQAAGQETVTPEATQISSSLDTATPAAIQTDTPPADTAPAATDVPVATDTSTNTPQTVQTETPAATQPTETTAAIVTAPTTDTPMAVPTIPNTIAPTAAKPATISAEAVILNDNRANATSISSLPFNDEINTVGATLESGEPVSSCGNNNNATVWYKYIPTATGNFEVDTTTDSFTDYDTVLTVFQSSSGGQINCNDDDNGQSGVKQSKLKFTGVKGSTYYIQVAARDNGSGGNLKLHMEQISCNPGLFCVTITDHNNQAATHGGYVKLLDASKWWIDGESVDPYGYVQLSSKPSSTYTLDASAWGVEIIKSGFSGPGAYNLTAAGLPGITVSALDKNGQWLKADNLAFVPYGYPTGIWDWVGNTQSAPSLTVYASPGKYGVSALSFTELYMLGLNALTFTTAANQAVVLDASKMSLDALTFHLDGLSTANSYFFANVPFSQPDPCCGQYMPVKDGDSVLVGLPSGTQVPVRAVVDWTDNSGNTWAYYLAAQKDFIAGSGPGSYTFGGNLNIQLVSSDGQFSPDDTGYMYKTVWDSYHNSLFYLDEQLNGSGNWTDVSPAYTSPDVSGYYDNSYDNQFDFTVPADYASTTLRASVTLDSGPYQGMLSTDITIPVVGISIVPPNDDFNSATLIGVTPFNPAELDTYGATLASDDPQSDSCSISAGQASVWYKYVSASGGVLNLDTSGSNYDTDLAVWTGTRGKLTLLGCNDDVSITPPDLTSALTINTVKGTTYYIEVLGFSSNSYKYIGSASSQSSGSGKISAQGAGGKLDFHANLSTVPNDYRAGATAVILVNQNSVMQFDDSISTVGATLESKEPVSTCGFNNDATVWYKFTPSGNGNFEVDTLDSDYDTVLTVFKSSSGGQINCNDNDPGQSNVPQSKLIFSGLQGTTYYIQVANREDGSGGDLKFHMEQVPCLAGLFCVTVTDHNSQASNQPYVILLDNTKWWIDGHNGNQYGYIKLNYNGNTKGPYSLVASNAQTEIIKGGISGPGAYGVTAAGLPGITVGTRDRNGQWLKADLIALVPYQYPTGIWQWVGNTQNASSLTVYASPGKYGVAALTFNKPLYVLGLNGLTFTTSANQSVVLDASKMKLDTLTIHFSGSWLLNPNQTAFAAITPFAQNDPCGDQTMMIKDGDSVLLGLPAGTDVPICADIGLGDISGNGWGYGLKAMNDFKAGSGPAIYNFGGSLHIQLDSLDGYYSPGDKGHVYDTVWDDYHNTLLGVNEQIPYPTGNWSPVHPSYSVQDSSSNPVTGDATYNTYSSYYEFNIPNPEPDGYWHTSVSLDSGPYQGIINANKDIWINNTLTAPSNDNFDNAAPFTVTPSTPFSTTLNTYGATLANDDPQSPNCSIDYGGGTVWYKYVSPSNGILSLDTIGSDYDTDLAVWSGKRGKLSLVGCNDDSSSNPPVLTSALTIKAAKGVTYYIEILGFSINHYLTGSSVGSQSTKSGGYITAQGAGGNLHFHASLINCWTLIASLNLSGAGSINIQPPANCVNGSYSNGTQVSLQALANTNFAFVNWTGTTTGADPDLTIPSITQNQVLTANFRSTIAPYVTLLNSNAATADKKLSPGETTAVAIKQLLVTFSKPMSSSSTSDAKSVTNPANYSLVEAGPDDMIGTSDDVAIAINSVSYKSSSKLATVNLNGGVALPSGRYAFTIKHFVQDLSINELDGNQDGIAGDDFSLNFNVNITPAAPGLIYPANKQAINTDIPVFTWKAAAQAVQYHIQISGNSAFSTILQDQIVAGGLSYPATHLADGAYYWRVAGINTFNVQGPWSKTSSFSIDTTP